ncbi:MAG: ATP-binding protein [Pseudomonadota bacterium]
MRTLKSRLFVLVAVGLLPLALMAILSLNYVIERQRHDAQRSALELSRALGTAIDAELRSTVQMLQTLSSSEALESLDFERFYRSARRLAQQQSWRVVILTDDAGRTLLRTNAPYGTSEWQTVEAASLAEAFETRRPTLGKTVGVPGKTTGPAFGVRYPFQMGGRWYVLSAVLTNDIILNVVRRQALPADWVVSVLDRDYGRVARSPPTKAPGISATLQATLNEGKPEGMARNTTVEGGGTHVGYSRLKEWGWTVVVGIPFSQISEAAFAPLASIAGGLLASLVLSFYLGRFFGGKVTEPIERLKQAADQLGQGEPVKVGKLDIDELDQVARALEHASQEREAYTWRIAEVQAEREGLLRQVTQGLERAEEAGRAKDEFLAVLGHELRNPLAPISMAVELMAIKGDVATVNERAAVTRQVKHMTRLVDDLLDIARITRKQLVMRSERVRLVAVVQGVLESVAASTGLRHIEFHGAEAADHAWVLGDEARLTQVFMNLIGNAIKFTELTGRIVVSVSVDAGHADVVISDDGVGMPQEVLKDAFRPFFQERQGSDRAGGGLGLGLAIVDSIVQMHGGEVSAWSAGKNQGSRLAVRLPLTAGPVLPTDLQTTREQQAACAKIFIVDDNEDAANITAEFLQCGGFEVKVAYHPNQALDMLANFVPDLAVLDIGLPGMTGYDLAVLWRAHPNGRASRLVALTGYAQADDIARAKAAGFDAHLAKPVDPDGLIEKIRLLLEQQAEQSV